VLGKNGLRLLSAFLLTASLALATGNRASAQATGVKAAPIAFKNTTDTILTIEAETITNRFGLVTPITGVWTLKPGEYSWLADSNNAKIHATRFEYRVKTPGKVSYWYCVSHGPDAHGYFTVVFSRDNLRTHRGEKVVALRPAFPPPQNGPTKEQLQNAGGKIVVAAVAHATARELAAKPNAGFAEKLAESFALGLRDAAIEGAVGDLFPRLSPGQRRDVQFLISDAVDGRLKLFNLNQQAAKQRLIQDLRAIDPDMADVAVIADFIYFVHQAWQQR
jgi:hypothetical protein